MASGAMSWFIDRARPCPETSTVNNNNNNIQYPRSILPRKKSGATATNHQFRLRCKGIIRLSDSDDSHQTPYCCMLHPPVGVQVCRHPQHQQCRSQQSVSLRNFIRHSPYETTQIFSPRNRLLHGVLRTWIQVRDSHRHELSEEKKEKDGKRFHSYRAIIRDD
ncbi:hypothetical protein CI102_10535 [Trichoderma harzianum]|nr:hypothetical protein CI102_10535 [Trichoderma harzianum]